MLGDLERFVAEDLYPYRIPITIGLLLGIAAAIAFAYRMGWHMVAWRHKLVTGIAAVAVLAVTIPAGDYFLSPLWERSFLEEESPLATAATDSVSRDDDTAPAATPVDVSSTPAPADEATALPSAPQAEIALAVRCPHAPIVPPIRGGCQRRGEAAAVMPTPHKSF